MAAGGGAGAAVDVRHPLAALPRPRCSLNFFCSSRESMGLHGSALVWAEGHYNGAIKTRKTVQPAVAQAQAQAPAAEAADQARSRQLRELFDSLAREAAAGGGPGFRDVHGCAQEARRPSAALAPEDLTETEWFYLMSASYSFPPGVGLKGTTLCNVAYQEPASHVNLPGPRKVVQSVSHGEAPSGQGIIDHGHNIIWLGPKKPRGVPKLGGPAIAHHDGSCDLEEDQGLDVGDYLLRGDLFDKGNLANCHDVAPLAGTSLPTTFSMRGCKSILHRRCIDRGTPRYIMGKVTYLAGKLLRTLSSSMSMHQMGATSIFSKFVTRSAKNPPYKSLVLRHLHNGISDLLLCDRVAKGRQVALREVYALPIEIMCPSLALVQHGSEVLLGQLLFLIMMHHCGAGGRSSSFYGLPGRAFARGGHVWLSRANEVDSKAFSRAILARSAGIKTVVCIPIVDGVLEIGTTEKVEEDIGLVQYAMAIFMDQQETHMTPSICHSNQTSHIDQQSFQTQGKTHTGQPKPEPNKFTPEYDDDEMEYDDNEIDTECASGSETNTGRGHCRHGPPNIASNDDHATHNVGRSSELMQVEMSERVRDGCSSNLGDEIQMLMVCQNSGDHSNLHGQDEPWHFLYEELCSGYPQSSGEDQAMAENAHYAHTVSLILHRNNALRQSDGPNTRSYLAVSHQSSFSRWDAGIHGRAVAEGTTRQKMLKSVLLFFNAACNKPPGDLRCDDAGARREVDFGASHVMQERKRREKLKMDKASILGDTIEYVKQLTKRIQDLESSVARQQVHGDLLVPKGSSERRALMGMEGPSSSSGSSSSAPVATDVQVSIIESDALLELRCPDRRGLLVTIMQALQEQLRLEVTSVQASSDRGVLLAEMRAKVREVHGRRSSISQVKRAIHLIISSG
uniref:Transcription factor TT8 n=1 Tax=Aegilops tauschii TaxID=37682 RepID=M8AGZ3_AEGTA